MSVKRTRRERSWVQRPKHCSGTSDGPTETASMTTLWYGLVVLRTFVPLRTAASAAAYVAFVQSAAVLVRWVATTMPTRGCPVVHLTPSMGGAGPWKALAMGVLRWGACSEAEAFVHTWM